MRKPSLRFTRDPEGPYMIGRESGFTDIGLAEFSCTFRANSERNRVWSLSGQWTVHRLPTSLIGREAVFGAFMGQSNLRLGLSRAEGGSRLCPGPRNLK